ncbi:hypothetical protein FQA39_LY12852 [Lamprigera yunnana]|nr:hypothetical protein FQA39_LY12852 [Lamprigera yunnana]
MRDSSDNLKGVVGIGEKGAIKLINEFGSLESIYENIDNITGAAVQQKLINDKENAFLCKEVATILTNIDFNGSFNIQELDINNDQLFNFFIQYEMRSLAKRFSGGTTGIKRTGAIDIKEKSSYIVKKASLVKEYEETILKQLEQTDQLNLYTKMEFPFIKVLFNMEKNGILINQDELKIQTEKILKEIISLEKDIILAQLSQEKTLLEVFENKQDIHEMTARKIFKLNKDSTVNAEQRRVAKIFNFGILYGLTDYGLSNDLKISVGEAKKYIADYYESFPDLLEFRGKMVDEALKMDMHYQLQNVVG